MKRYGRSRRSREKHADSMMTVSTGLTTAVYVAILTLLVSSFVQLAAKGDSAWQTLDLMLRNNTGFFFAIALIMITFFVCAYFLQTRAQSLYDEERISRQNAIKRAETALKAAKHVAAQNAATKTSGQSPEG